MTEQDTTHAGAFVSAHDPGMAAVSVLDAATFSGTTTVAMDCHIFNGGIDDIVLTATKVGVVR